MVRTRTLDSTRQAEHEITALHDGAASVPEVRNAAEVVAERSGRRGDCRAAAEVVAPGIRRRTAEVGNGRDWRWGQGRDRRDRR